MLRYHIQTIELSVPTPVINISNIPQIYDDLYLVTSLRSDGGGTGFFARLAMTFNNVTTNRSSRVLYGFNSGSVGSEPSSTISWFYTVSSSATANTFGNNGIYISNYRTTQNKTISIDSVTEHNGNENIGSIVAGLWADSSAINSIQIFFNEAGSNFVANSSVSLYGIKRGSDGKTEVASGGTITTSGGYTIHTFNSSGTFVANRDMDVEYLVIGGGGGGGGNIGGGGGAGGYRCSVVGESSGGGASAEQKLRVNSGSSYTVTVGAGGAGSSSAPTAGSNSVFSTITSTAGGGGGYDNANTATTGGSGGGGGAGTLANPGKAGTANQGYAGGTASTGGTDVSSAGGGGGSGGTGANGGSNVGGNGGAGVSSFITGSSVTRAGGGGGATFSTSVAGTGGSGGSGGGGNGYTNTSFPVAGGNATANTGSGGGGGSRGSGSGGNGGSGVVIIRYLTPAS